jgi:uncharacterized protein YukJ
MYKVLMCLYMCYMKNHIVDNFQFHLYPRQPKRIHHCILHMKIMKYRHHNFQCIYYMILISSNNRHCIAHKLTINQIYNPNSSHLWFYIEDNFLHLTLIPHHKIDNLQLYYMTCQPYICSKYCSMHYLNNMINI